MRYRKENWEKKYKFEQESN